MKKLLLLFVFCLLFSAYSPAQPPPPPPPGPLSGADVPIDKDVALLLIATAFFGVFKIYPRKKSPTKPNL